MIVCFMTKTPLFLCGKPGSSKSLSLSLVMSNFRGAQSLSNLFKKLPELKMIYYQCSPYSTSEGFESIFKKANDFSEMVKKSKKIIVLIFEEIGLAELSPYNPLKVLHSKLEIE